MEKTATLIFKPHVKTKRVMLETFKKITRYNNLFLNNFLSKNTNYRWVRIRCNKWKPQCMTGEKNSLVFTFLLTCLPYDFG